MLSATGRTNLLPVPFPLLCPLPFRRFFNFPSSRFWAPSASRFCPQVWIWNLERSQLTQQPVCQNQVSGGGERSEKDSSHRYTLTYIHFHPADWVLCRGLRPIVSEGGVRASQWRQPLFYEVSHCLHTVFSDYTAAERASKETERGRMSFTDERLKMSKRKRRRKKRWGWANKTDRPSILWCCNLER